MKKVLRTIFYILLIISVALLAFILIKNLYIVIRILFFGMSFGSNQYPDSIFWGKVFLKGINGVKQYYLTLGSIILLSEVPVAIISIIYQVVFFKIIKVKILKKCPKK